MEYKYGDAWERFPIEAGEVWGCPGHGSAFGSKVSVHNIFDPLPKFMLSADLLFIDPPWNLGNINTFYTKAGRSDYLETFTDFSDILFRRIAEIDPMKVYIEIGNQNVEDYRLRLRKLFPTIQAWRVTYYRKYPTWILRGAESPIDYDFTGIDEAKCISLIAQIEQYKIIGDLCMGRGLVGLAAYKVSKTFVGTELNKRRLACLLAAIAKAGGQVGKIEDHHE